MARAEPRLPAYYRGVPAARWRAALVRRRESVRYRPAHGAKPRDTRRSSEPDARAA